MYSQEIIKGVIKPMIIKLLSENDRMYGYQITKKVKEISSDRLTFTEGALYPALHKLVKDGVLITEIEFTGNRKRKYYKLSVAGKENAPSRLQEIQESILLLADLFDLKVLLKNGIG